MKIKEILKYGIEELKQDEDKILKAKLLLAFLLDVPKEYLNIHMEEEINSLIEIKYKENLDKLKKGVPLQYIINKQEFMGITFYVDERVLIPQPDTEILVEEVLKKISEKAKKNETIEILDLCTGSGAIGISISIYFPNSLVTIRDISEDALEVAKLNVEKQKCKNIKIVKSDFFDGINGKFDIIVSNPPYIKTEIIRYIK